MKTSKINLIIPALIIFILTSYGCGNSPVTPGPVLEPEIDTRLIGSWVNSSRCTENGGFTWTFTFEKENPRNGNGLDIKQECHGSREVVENIAFSWTQIDAGTIHYVCRIEKDITYSIEGDTLFVGSNRTKYLRVE